MFFPTLAGLFVFALLLKAVAPSIYAGDGGELISASYLLGNAHPPGYPLYLLFARVFSFLPVGNIAWRFNLLNAFLAGICAALFYQLSRYFLSKNYSLLATLFLLCFSSFFYYSLFAEVYHLELFLFILLLLSWFGANKRKYLLMGLFTGLGIVSHYGYLLLILGFLPFALKEILRGAKGEFGYLFGIMMVFVGLTAFGYLPLRAARQPAFNWGNPVNYHSVINKLTRSEYREPGSRRSPADILKQFKLTAIFFQRQMFFPVLLLAVPGLIYFYGKHKTALYLLLSILVSYTVLATCLLNYRVTSLALDLGPKFFLPVYLVLALFMGAGLNFIPEKISGINVKYLVLISLLLIMSLIGYQGFSLNERANTIYRDYGLDILTSLPPKARLMASGDNPLFAVLYLKYVEKRRPDLVLTAVEGNIFNDEFGYRDLSVPQIKDLERQIIRRESRPLFYTNYTSDLPLKAQPLLYKLIKNREKGVPDLPKYLHSANGGGKKERAMMLTTLLSDRYVNYAYYLAERKKNPRKYLQTVSALGWNYPYIMEQLGRFYFNNNKYPEAKNAYERANELSESYSRYNQLGLIYKQLGQPGLAERHFNKSINLNHDFAIGYYNLATLYLARGEVDKALANSDRVIAIYPQYLANYYLRCLIFQKLGKIREARFNLEKFLKYSSGANEWTEKARNALEQIK